MASRILSAEPMRAEESEAYQSPAIQQWALRPLADTASHSSLSRFADIVLTNHGDPWLKDFIRSRPSSKANGLLLSAINLNYSGDASHALKSGSAAEKVFKSQGNWAGALRARFEQIYALRRLSRASDCLRSSSFLRILQERSYAWLEAQTSMELASCNMMKSRPDRSQILSKHALDTAESAHYGNLRLRAYALRGNLDMHDGRSRALWGEDEPALALFWSGSYPGERGFQLYHDLQLDSEMAGLDHAALLLQRETLAMIRGQGRLDFEAIAHFRMAETAGRLGNLEEERRELGTYRTVLDQLPVSSGARVLYEAYCDIGLARLAIHSGDRPGAATYLKTAERVLEGRDNSTLEFEYLNAASELARASRDVLAEQRYLKAVVAIGNRQFKRFNSSADRWHWQQLMDSAHRRLLELLLLQPHSPSETFATWHKSRTLDEIPDPEATNEEWARNHLHPVQDRKLVSFAVLTHSTVAWVASANSIREFVLPVGAHELRREAHAFYLLCSDSHSALEKVNDSGSRLYGLLIAPLEQELGETRRIVIATDSFLSFISWTALRTPSGQYWGQIRDLTVHVGFATPTAPSHRAGAIRRMVVATPGAVTEGGLTYLPLVQAEEEARHVSSFFSQARRLRPGESSASRLIEELGRAEGLHFAGHAVTRGEGGELITDEEAGPAFLSSVMLRNTHMPNLRFVVLSACSTASPENISEQNPDGLVKGFVIAGVPVVVASRWDVDSYSTAQLMKVFYEHFTTGSSADEALALATRSLLSDSKFRHPYYWSAFQVFSAN